MNSRYYLITAVMYLVCAAVLAGFAVFYFVTEQIVSGIIFIVIAVLSVAYGVYKLFKYKKLKQKSEEDQNNKHGFL